jgi:hypothetical protein
MLLLILQQGHFGTNRNKDSLQHIPRMDNIKKPKKSFYFQLQLNNENLGLKRVRTRE